MRTESVLLRHPGPDAPPAATLREPDGHDEMAVDGVDTACTIALLGRLLVSPKINATTLSACDRDALLAALHRECWGDRIVSTLICANCASRFDVSFQLSDLQRHLAEYRAAEYVPCRVPGGQDEIAAAAHGASQGAVNLARACDVGPEDLERASDSLAARAPIVDLELAATCTECGHAQGAHFDLQSFLLQRLLNERGALLAEIHALAGAYGWSLHDILSISRSTRRALSEALERARPA